MKAYAKKYDVKTVVTNDVHYIDKEDAESQDILMCVQTSSNFDTPNRMKMPCDEFYFKSYDEMLAAFPGDEESLDRAVEIANKCDFGFEYGHYMFPHYYPETKTVPPPWNLSAS